MTVRELIEELSKHPSDMRVVVDMHSEYDEVTGVKTIVGFETGGYVSRVYRDTDKAMAHGWVYIG